MFVLFDVSFFFFKQKTAYEMRISDWSSDVCSSDLLAADHIDRGWHVHDPRLALLRRNDDFAARLVSRLSDSNPRGQKRHRASDLDQLLHFLETPVAVRIGRVSRNGRSEEHTSELQSLMRISYDVFCLKKKKQKERQ